MVGRSPLLRTCLCLAWFISHGCGEDPVNPLPEQEGNGLEISRLPLVEHFEPASAARGSLVALHVHGQNFDEGSRVDLLLSGDVIGEVQTLSTRFVTPEELVADISIADDAPVGPYEVQVRTSEGKRGIPIEDFTILEMVRGAIELTVVTVGATDPDGYVFTLDNEPTQPIGNETKTIDGLTVGTHSLLLGGLAAHCLVSGPNPLTVTVTGDGATVIVITVSCTAGLTGRIAFSSYRDGSDLEIYVMNADGSDVQRLTENNVLDGNPAWSPDGTRIAFGQYESGGDYNAEIVVMNADGSNVQEVTPHPSFAYSHAWSVDNRIAFERHGDPSPCSFDPEEVCFPGEIYTINPDGSDLRRVTNNTWPDGDPAWSPDGRRIAFASNLFGGDVEIVTADPDGENLVNLTNHRGEDLRPAWSPDGTRIAFVSSRDGNYEIYVMNADGTGLQRLTNHPDVDYHPTWSPDGRMIAFVSNRVRINSFAIYVMNADGTGLVMLTPPGVHDAHPAWIR